MPCRDARPHQLSCERFIPIKDTLDNIHWPSVDVFADCVANAVDVLERNCVMQRTFTGLPCLSNPRYGLYQERPDPAVVKDLAYDSEKWGYLGDCLLRYFDGKTTVLDVAEKHALPFAPVRDRIQQFADAGLLSLFPASVRSAISRPQVK